MKKTILTILLLTSMSAFAENQNASSVDNTKKLNKATVGSRQSGSEQDFGNPKIVGQNGQKHYNVVTSDSNKATVGSRQSGSEQVFGNPKLTGKPGVKVPQTGTQYKMNNPNVGGRQSSSDQIFGNPGSDPQSK